MAIRAALVPLGSRLDTEKKHSKCALTLSQGVGTTTGTMSSTTMPSLADTQHKAELQHCGKLQSGLALTHKARTGALPKQQHLQPRNCCNPHGKPPAGAQKAKESIPDAKASELPQHHRAWSGGTGANTCISRDTHTYALTFLFSQASAASIMDWECTFKVESIPGNWLFFKGIFTGCSNSHNSINIQQYYTG